MIEWSSSAAAGGVVIALMRLQHNRFIVHASKDFSALGRVDPVVTEFLAQLTRQGFNGDSATAYADRLAMATDNSIYQLLPDAVIFPRSDS